MAKNGGGEKLKRKEYDKELHKLQVELCHLQAWVKDRGERIIIVFEGRDAAGEERRTESTKVPAASPSRTERRATFATSVVFVMVRPSPMPCPRRA